jgi:hypothetical protein
LCVSAVFLWALSVLYGIVVLEKRKGETHMKNQNFGIEIELTGITRRDAARVLAQYFGTTEEYAGGTYRAYHIKDQNGRIWKAVYDSSIRAERRNGNAADEDYKCEIVSPICGYDDIPTIQELVRQLRKKGAIANKSCGIHVHINAAPHTARSLKNISNIMASKEDLLFKALGVDGAREYYCKKVEPRYISGINRKKPKTKDELKTIWYNGDTHRSQRHYDDSRYRALNLHAVWQKGTVEFRLFNGTTHAGKIKAYIQLCLAISRQAMTQSCASAKKTVTDNEKYTFRTWLLRLGLIGKEFETARQHLLANLNGDTAFRHGRPGAAA